MILYPYNMQQNLTQRSDPQEVISTITSKGQITLPLVIRRHLGVDYNDRVAFIVEPSGDIKVRHVKYPDIQSLRGVAGVLKKPLLFKEMRQIAEEDRLNKKYGK